MRCVGIVTVLLFALTAGPALADPGYGPRETVDQSFTTTQPGAATGLDFHGTYHAANDPNGEPPYLERMIFYPPAGQTFDTSVPGQCTASDAELSMSGPAACPADSRIGEGRA